jgi:hypothetical protein
MTRYCSDCANLNLKKEKPPGCYECKKRKKEKVKSVWACMEACDKYEFDWSRGERKRQEVFKKALKEIHVDRKPMKASELFVFTLFALILFLIALLSKK